MNPILVADLFAPLNDELIALLRSLNADEWNAKAVGTWTVKDVASHLLDTLFRRLSAHRDRYSPPLGMADSLAAVINDMNEKWVNATRRLSPQILVEMLERYGADMAKHMMTLDPYAPAEWPVSWAGDEASPNWFDTARELTERWHHQQQIRDATNRPPLYDMRFFKPVIDTFLRALPYAYRNAQANDGTAIEFKIRGVSDCILQRASGKWQLETANGQPTTTVRMSGDTAWRLFTKGLAREEARRRSEISGDPALAEPLFSMLAIIA